jgi:hypothetical protein
MINVRIAPISKENKGSWLQSWIVFVNMLAIENAMLQCLELKHVFISTTRIQRMPKMNKHTLLIINLISSTNFWLMCLINIYAKMCICCALPLFCLWMSHDQIQKHENLVAIVKHGELFKKNNVITLINAWQKSHALSCGRLQKLHLLQQFS